MKKQNKYKFIQRRLSKSEFREEVKALVHTIQTSTTKLPEENKKERIKKAKNDFYYFAKTYFPHYCTKPFETNQMLLEPMEAKQKDDDVVIPIVIVGPREHGKSVQYRLIDDAWDVVFERYKLGAFGATNEETAKDHLFYLALEFAVNKRLIQDFGELCPTNYKGSSVIFENNVKRVTLGKGSSVKGLLHGPYRLEKFIGDDLEKGKEAKSKKQVDDLLDWLSKDVYGAMPDHGKMIILGNNSERNCAIDKIIKEYSDRWRVFVYKALYNENSKDEYALWPDQFTVEKLKAKRKIMGRKAWSSDWQQDPISPSAVFKEEEIIRKEQEPEYERIYVAVDPSVGDDPTSCFKAIVAIGEYTRDKQMYFDIVTSWIRQQSVEKMIDVIFEFDEVLNPTLSACEDNVGQKFLFPIIYDRERQKGKRLNIKGITSRESKASRIESLSPYIERGILRVCYSGDNETLIDQLVTYPSKPDDGPDAAGIALKLVKSKGRKAKSVII